MCIRDRVIAACADETGKLTPMKLPSGYELATYEMCIRDRVNAARRLNGCIVTLALPLGVKLRAVRQIDALCRHIHLSLIHI